MSDAGDWAAAEETHPAAKARWHWHGSRVLWTVSASGPLPCYHAPLLANFTSWGRACFPRSRPVDRPMSVAGVLRGVIERQSCTEESDTQAELQTLIEPPTAKRIGPLSH